MSTRDKVDLLEGLQLSGSSSSREEEASYLRWFLQMGLIATKNSPRWMHWVNLVVCVNVCLVGYGAVIYIPYTSFVTREHSSSSVSVAGRITFCTYTTSVYLYMSHLARSSPDIVTSLKHIGRREDNNPHSCPCTTKYPIKMIVLIVLILTLGNVMISVFTEDLSQQVFGLTHHPVFLWYLQVVMYFFSFSWMVSIPIVYWGCKLLTEKIMYLKSYVRAELKSEDGTMDLFYVMAWHDELYERNRLLTDMISGLVTLTIGFLATASTIVAMHTAIVGINRNDLFWFLANFFILVATCYPVAELEIQNRLLAIEYGSLPMPKNIPNLNLYLNLYQTCTIKSSKSEFGIFVKGTRIRITLSALLRVGSITISAMIFLAGLLRVTN